MCRQRSAATFDKSQRAGDYPPLSTSPERSDKSSRIASGTRSASAVATKNRFHGSLGTRSPVIDPSCSTDRRKVSVCVRCPFHELNQHTADVLARVEMGERVEIV